MMWRTGIQLVVLALVVMLTACSTHERKAVYESRQDIRPLEMPPDLRLPRGTDSMAVPQFGTRLSDYQDTQASGTHNLLPEVQGIRFVREGGMHWLEMREAPRDVWPQMQDFLRAMGFDIESQDQRIGLMETNWLENRADVPTNWLSHLFRKLYSTGLLDRYRVRLERSEEGTRVFIAHRGMEQVLVSDDRLPTTSEFDTREGRWQPRPSDPDLEVEMLQRFLVFRGLGEQTATRVVAPEQLPQRTRLVERNDSPVLQLNESFPRAWRQVGLALDRLGLIIEDRNRSAGVYYIKLTEEFKAGDEKGFFAGLFSRDQKQPVVDELVLRLEDKGEITELALRDRQGGQLARNLSQRILGELEPHLR